MKFAETDRFSPAAQSYKKYGYYTDAIPGTREYYEFWDVETERCINGYEVFGVKIT